MDVERQYQAPASYPRKALRLAKEGYVIVEFDVSADGDVIDPFVLEGEPAGLSIERNEIYKKMDLSTSNL